MPLVCAESITKANEFVVPEIATQKRGRGNPKSRRQEEYADIITAFDIETSRLKDIEQSFMYIWQFQWGSETTIIGRTWEEFTSLLQRICEKLKGKQKLVVWVHNLSYEFQFLRGIYDFKPEEVFCIERRKILKCEMFGKIEFRCSYLHSNMSLEMYTNKMKAAHPKMVDDLDYNIVRWPYTELTETELGYCLNDVRGLVEAVYNELEHDNDNLYTVPLTSTGYVRRDTKKAVCKSKKPLARQIAPDFAIYTELREAFRGGNTHANRYYSGKVMDNVKSFDRSSSYPDVLCNCEFPISEFQEESENTPERLVDLIDIRGKAVLFRVALYDVTLTDEFFGCPYLAKDKCRSIVNGQFDNGRILAADYLETTLTEVDWKIVREEYSFSDMIPHDIYSARKGKLPQPIIDTNIKYYKLKTELKNVNGQELLYMKSKNKLNSIYGMMAQNPLRDEVIFTGQDFELDNSQTKEERLTENNKKCFLAYQWGVWCTAWARYRLEEGIKMAGDGFIYCDTDSVKYVGDVDFTDYNKKRIADSKESGTYATDPKGVTHFMGVYEQEPTYQQFCTMGAKKYCYVIDGKLHATIAGVSKKDGGRELEKAGGIKAFKDGFVFHEAGGTESVYNDGVDMWYKMPNGEKLHITSNVVIKDSTYTLGLTAEYARLLEFYQDYDNPFKNLVDSCE